MAHDSSISVKEFGRQDQWHRTRLAEAATGVLERFKGREALSDQVRASIRRVSGALRDSRGTAAALHDALGELIPLAHDYGPTHDDQVVLSKAATCWVEVNAWRKQFTGWTLRESECRQFERDEKTQLVTTSVTYKRREYVAPDR